MKKAQNTSLKSLWLLLAASATMNLTGVAWGLHHYLREAQEDESKSSSTVSAVPIPSYASVVPSQTPAPSHVGEKRSDSPAPAKFQWQNLETGDYGTFITRLREVGCPENTVKDIVAGELKAKAADRRAELEKKILRSSDWSPPRGVSRQEYLASQLRKLDREIELAANGLLQSSTSAASASSPGSSASVATPEAAGPQENYQPPVRYPAVMDDVAFQPSSTGEMHYVAPGAVEASRDQLTSIKEIQEQFVQEVGGMNQDVEDPQYEEIWRTAQWRADQVFRARHGMGAYGEVQRAAAQKTYDDQRKASPVQ